MSHRSRVPRVQQHVHCDSCYSRRCRVRLEVSVSCAVIPCRLLCGALFHLCKEEDHMLLCPNVRVPCLNAEFGCQVHLPRSSQAAHLQLCPASVVCCSMEWIRWPVDDTNPHSNLALQENVMKENEVQEEALDFAMALVDQTELTARLKMKNLYPELMEEEEKEIKDQQEEMAVAEFLNGASNKDTNEGLPTSACAGNSLCESNAVEETVPDSVGKDFSINIKNYNLCDDVRHGERQRVYDKPARVKSEPRSVDTSDLGATEEDWLSDEAEATLLGYAEKEVMGHKISELKGADGLYVDEGTQTYLFRTAPFKQKTTLAEVMVDRPLKLHLQLQSERLALVSQLMRQVCYSLLQERGIVTLHWEKKTYSDEGAKWKAKPVWEFSHLFSAVDSWHLADTPPISAHLNVCPYYETSPHSERVALPGMTEKRGAKTYYTKGKKKRELAKVFDKQVSSTCTEENEDLQCDKGIIQSTEQLIISSTEFPPPPPSSSSPSSCIVALITPHTGLLCCEYSILHVQPEGYEEVILLTATGSIHSAKKAQLQQVVFGFSYGCREAGAAGGQCGQRHRLPEAGAPGHADWSAAGDHTPEEAFVMLSCELDSRFPDRNTEEEEAELAARCEAAERLLEDQQCMMLAVRGELRAGRAPTAEHRVCCRGEEEPRGVEVEEGEDEDEEEEEDEDYEGESSAWLLSPPLPVSPSQPEARHKRRVSVREERVRACIPQERVTSPERPHPMPDPALFLVPLRYRLLRLNQPIRTQDEEGLEDEWEDIEDSRVHRRVDMGAGGEKLLCDEDKRNKVVFQQDDLEDDLLTVSTSVTNPTLEPENFLYPDIKHSNLRGDVTQVEPMVCLLVSEEEEESDEANEQIGQLTVETDLNIKEKVINTTSNIHLPEEHTEHTAGQSSDHKQENMKREEDYNKTGLQRVVEGGAEIMLFSVDRLFLAAPHVKALPSPTEERPEDDRPEQSDVDKRKQLTIHDIIDLQETGFTVRIQSPGAESFELQVSGQLLVAELHQVLMEHKITCHRTCFSLQLGGTALDGLTELCSIEGIQDGALIKVVEDSYSVRDACLHLRHVRDLLRSLDPADAYNGVNCSSLSYLTLYIRGDKNSESVGNRQASEKESVDFRPPEYILPGCKDRPLSPLQPVRDDWKPLQCLRVLTMSSWNPLPGNRKMHGDLMYLNVLTMEDKELNITSSTRCFYLNQSTAFNFNPKPAVPKIFCHSLVELLSQVSPAFRKTFSALQKKRVQQHPYERIATPFQLFTWIAHQGDHTLNCVRAEETHTSCMGQDEHTAGQSRDWNEELQGCRELSRNSLQERLHRERSIFRTNSDFVEAATRGAVAVVDGNVMPLNPAQAPHMQIFIWNNLFFSLGFDISEHYHPLGGNTAALAAAICDLRGAQLYTKQTKISPLLQAYTSVDIEGLHTLGTAVVDYRGVRVIAQTIVPGILEKNQEQSVVYGSNDYRQTVFTHPRFLELLDKTSKPLRIQRHQVLDHRNSPVKLCSGIETKGILGNDVRPYILDLLRTFPPDLNNQFIETAESSEVPKECQSFDYPRQHHHSLASLRPELIEAFVQHRYELYVKLVSQGLIQLEEQEKFMGTGDAATDGADMELQRRIVIMKACKAAGSVSDSGFDICFNPDVCSSGVCFSFECVKEIHRQRQLLWDAAAFLLSKQIPAVLRDCLEHTAVPMNGATLTAALHQRGVNVRYLGTLLRELDKMEERGRLSHIQVQLKEYVFESRHRPAFSEEDVVNVFPVVKHLKPTGTDATRLVQHAQTHLALYCFAGGQLSTSLQLLYRARYPTLLVIGEDHPQVALLDSMLGLVLHGLMEYELSQKFLQNALILTSKYHGVMSLKHAHSHHLLATVYESKGEFRSALQHVKEAYSLYKNQFQLRDFFVAHVKVGEDHDSTKESSDYLKSLTQQAVILQKAINQLYSNTHSTCIPPPKFSTPSLPAILQQLNLVCGIILIPLSAKEIADLRTELKERVKMEEMEKRL
ncbi:Clustered mitochondria protein -like protein [Collichthys lucidus]|uniref:Clustered mitochondria protein-like protein n=1 Tax=Collichthys lucidus TaxID=240159 RepID=A0A4U5TVD4_COLLU|nr:Clustered mitochondria protein -like protein [Collichthys lucidus]